MSETAAMDVHEYHTLLLKDLQENLEVLNKRLDRLEGLYPMIEKFNRIMREEERLDTILEKVEKIEKWIMLFKEDDNDVKTT